MASALSRDPVYGAARTVDAVNDKMLVQAKLKRLGMSPRQMELNRMYSYFRTQQHESCAVDWDGSEHSDPVTREAIVTQRTMPPGYKDLGSISDLPLRYRRPSVPCHMCKVIVSRFTGLLFSEETHPTWKVLGDPDTEAWVAAVTKHYGLWSKLALVRDMGGAMGTPVMGFKIIDGRVIFEEFDARWCFPKFEVRNPKELEELEVKYIYPKDVQDEETGDWREENYWYRRLITKSADVLWKPIAVGDGDEPNWQDPQNVADGRTHDLGFVPVVWGQNIEVSGDVDGDPDCMGAYDYFDRIGELDSQCHKGALRNADPTPVVESDGNLTNVKLGSEMALKLEKGANAHYLEIAGGSVKAAAEQADRLRSKALEVCECVLPDQEATDGAPQTATEIHKRTAAMYARAARLREQYGNRLVVPLMQKLVRVARKVTSASKGPDGSIVRGGISLPPAIEGKQAKEIRLGNVQSAQLELVWPPFSVPTADEGNTVVTATAAAVNARVVSRETAVRHVAPVFNIEDIDAELEKIEKDGPPPGQDLAAAGLGNLQQGAE
jgi:hypothetical protein